MNALNAQSYGETPIRDKTDIEQAFDRLEEKSDNTARLIDQLRSRLDSVLKPAMPAGGNGGITGIEKARSPLDHKLGEQSAFIGENNAKLQDILDRLAV